jgi:hypothetical protein
LSLQLALFLNFPYASRLLLDQISKPKIVFWIRNVGSGLYGDVDPDPKPSINKLKVRKTLISTNVIFFNLLPCVADPGCLSRIPDPDFYPSRIPDPGSRIPDPKTATKERGEKK